MTDHPSTFKGDQTHRPGIQWNDRASLHQIGDGDGVLHSTHGLRDGTFVDLIRHIMLLPESDREKYYIEKMGDREYHHTEIASLAARDDFPHS